MGWVNIQVSRQDIAEGIPKDGYDCPIARAWLRQYPKGDAWVSLTNRSIFTFDHAQVFECNLPMKARKFAQDFDRGDRVHPIAFNVRYKREDVSDEV